MPGGVGDASGERIVGQVRQGVGDGGWGIMAVRADAGRACRLGLFAGDMAGQGAEWVA